MKKRLAWIYRLYSYLRQEKMSRWQRCLPFADLIVDRWEKARFLEFGEGTSVYDSSYVFGDVKVGRNTWIGPLTILDGTGGLEIGDNCSISAGVQIYTHDTVMWAVSGGKSPADHAPVKIGSNCYIGPNTVIAKGVTVGEGTIVGASSLVLKSIPPNSRAYGVPCRVTGKVSEQSQLHKFTG